MSSRRDFIATAASGVAGVTTAFAAPAALACPGAARRIGGSPTKQAFDALVGQTLQVDLGNGRRADLQLQAVHGHASRQPLEQFSLVLRGDIGRAVDGGIYRVAHPSTSRFQLRLDPSGEEAHARLYRADFSLLV